MRTNKIAGYSSTGRISGFPPPGPEVQKNKLQKDIAYHIKQAGCAVQFSGEAAKLDLRFRAFQVFQGGKPKGMPKVFGKSKGSLHRTHHLAGHRGVYTPQGLYNAQIQRNGKGNCTYVFVHCFWMVKS